MLPITVDKSKHFKISIKPFTIYSNVFVASKRVLSKVYTSKLHKQIKMLPNIENSRARTKLFLGRNSSRNLFEI